MPSTNRTSRHDRPGDADRVSYHPNDSTDWTHPEPETVQQGLDDLAAAVTAGALPVVDTTALVKGSADATKQVRLEADGLTSGVTRILTMPDQDVDLGGDFAPASHNHNTSDLNAGLLALARGGLNADASAFAADELLRLNAAGTAVESAGVQASDLADVRVRVYNSAAVSIPTNVQTALTFDGERWDTDGMHSTTSNTSRLTAQTAGWYVFGAAISWQGVSGTTRRSLGFKLNGTTWLGLNLVPSLPGISFHISAGGQYYLNVNDYIECFVRQDSGVNITVRAVGNYSMEFFAVRIPGT